MQHECLFIYHCPKNINMNSLKIRDLQQVNDGNSLISSLLADKNQILHEDFFSLSFKGQSPFKSTVHEVNFSSLFQAMIVNKKVDGLNHKRENDSSDLNTQTNLSNNYKNHQMDLIVQENTNQESKPQQFYSSFQFYYNYNEEAQNYIEKQTIRINQSQNLTYEQTQLPLIDNFIINNNPIIKEPVRKVKQINKQEAEHSEYLLSTSFTQNNIEGSVLQLLM